MSDLGDWYRSVPFFTRYWLSLTVGFTLLGRFGLVNPINLILLYEPIKRFQLWRLVTCVFYYPLSPAHGFQFLLNLYFLYNYSRRLETGHYGGKPADYFTLLVFNWLCAVIIGLILNFSILLEIMVLSVLYVWCQLNKDVIVSFWFGTRFKAMYLPWVFLGFNMILSGGGITELIGILIGHLYVFLMFQYPQELGGRVLLTTPAIFKEWFPDTVGGVHTFGAPPQRPPQPRNRGRGMFGGHNWGTGHVLGGQ
ncbi:der1-like protein derlin [Holotrichia oblita]|uniref:Der1-like protein derlin n=1 Tax=Holotrichia oblita TaxID=644536 RepID=A0ACB9TQG8_HOLOL|nr:der1-like protein derlin [Holotrichia oblita]